MQKRFHTAPHHSAELTFSGEYPVADPIWLDSNTLIRVIDGDYVLAAEMMTMQAQGRPLLIVPAVRNEILYGNPLTMKGNVSTSAQAPQAVSRALAEKVMKQLKVQVDMEAAKLGHGQKIATGTGRIDAGQAKRVGYAMQDHVQRPRNLAVPNSLNNISESDSLVLSQIKASAEARGVSKPQIFTAESPTKAMVSQAGVYGVEPVRPKSPPLGSGGGGASLPPTIDLADYPADRESGLARFFRDRPVLKQAGLVGAHIAASQVGPIALQLMKSHYSKVISEASKEFNAKCPDASDLWRDARIDDYKKAYETALLKMKLPSAARIVGGVRVALTRKQDQDEVWKRVRAELSRVKLPNGAIAGYGDAGTAYIKTMADLYEKYSNCSLGLRDAAADIQKRANVLGDAADSLNDMFWKVAPVSAVFPPAYYAWLDVHTVADTLADLGKALAAFADEIRSRQKDYELFSDKLDKQLMKVSEELDRYAP
jgi:hypothetical protein